MPDIKSLASRIDAEFSAVEDKVKKFQVEQVEEHKQRQKRFEAARKGVRGRLTRDLEAATGASRGEVRGPSSDQATDTTVHSRGDLRLSIGCWPGPPEVLGNDRPGRPKGDLGLRLGHHPRLHAFKSHDEVEFPLNAIDKEAVAKWIDDRVVRFRADVLFDGGERNLFEGPDGRGPNRQGPFSQKLPQRRSSIGRVRSFTSSARRHAVSSRNSRESGRSEPIRIGRGERLS